MPKILFAAYQGLGPVATSSLVFFLTLAGIGAYRLGNQRPRLAGWLLLAAVVVVAILLGFGFVRAYEEGLRLEREHAAAVQQISAAVVPRPGGFSFNFDC